MASGLMDWAVAHLDDARVKAIVGVRGANKTGALESVRNLLRARGADEARLVSIDRTARCSIGMSTLIKRMISVVFVQFRGGREKEENALPNRCMSREYGILLAMEESNASQMRAERMPNVSGKGVVCILRDDHFKRGVEKGSGA